MVSGSDYQEINQGKIDQSGAGINATTPFDSTSQGILFDVNTDTLTIDTVVVYPQGTGDLVVRIKNSSGQLLFFANYPISGGTGLATKIPIGVTLPPGTDYKMDAYGSTIGGAFASSGGQINYATYFSTYSVLNIKNSLDLNTNRYWFFYNWTVTITPSVNLNWSNLGSGTSINGLSAGTYTVTLTDNNACSAFETATVTVPQPSQITTVTSLDQGINCEGDTARISVQASGGEITHANVGRNDNTNGSFLTGYANGLVFDVNSDSLTINSVR